MTTSYLRPNGNATLSWAGGGGSSYTKIDEGVTQPTVPTDGLTNHATDADDNEEEVFNLTNPIDATDEVTSLIIWWYATDTSGGEITFRLNINGSWLSTGASSATGWHSKDYGVVAYVGSDFDSAQLGVKAGSVSKGDAIKYSEAYVEVNHEAVGAPLQSSMGSPIFAGKIFSSPIFGLQVPRSRMLWIPQWGVWTPRRRFSFA